MASKTLEAMLAAARDHADMEGSAYVSDAELTRAINQAAARFRRRLYHVLGGTIARSTATFTTTADVATVDLTGVAIYRLDGVDIQYSSDWVRATKFDFRDRNRKQNIAGWPRGSVRYRLENHSEAQPRIRFVPTPNAVETFRIWYLPGHTTLSAPGDLMYLPDDYFEWVELMAARKQRGKADLDTRDLNAQLKELAEEIKVEADAAEQDEGGAVLDVYRYEDDPDDEFEFGLPSWLS